MSVAERLTAAAKRLRAARAQYPDAHFVAVDPQVIDALAAWLESEVGAAAFITDADNEHVVNAAFGQALDLTDAILWDVPR